MSWCWGWRWKDVQKRSKKCPPDISQTFFFYIFWQIQPSRLKSCVLTLAGGLRPPDLPISRPPASPKNLSKMAVLSPETSLDGPGLSRDSVFRPEMPKRTRPGQFRPTFGPRPKVGKTAPSQKFEFCLIGRYPFHGTLLGASPRADIRKSLHSMGLRTCL